MSWRDLTPPEDSPRSGSVCLALRRERPDYSVEERFIGKDGSTAWVELTVSLRRDDEGEPAYAIAVCRTSPSASGWRRS